MVTSGKQSAKLPSTRTPVAEELPPVVVHDERTADEIPVPQATLGILHREIEALTRLSAPTLGFLAGHEDFADEAISCSDEALAISKGASRRPVATLSARNTQARPISASGCSGIDFGTDHVGDKEVDIKK